MRLYATKELSKARIKYSMHKAKAKQRKIPFLFTFEEWYQIWLDSGHWEQRGVRRGQYCMARHNDIGAYEGNNVSIITNTENIQFSSTKYSVKGICRTTNNEITLTGNLQIRMAGFHPPAVFDCLAGRQKSHRGHTWQRV